MRNAGANLSVVEGVVAPRVLDAMRSASDELTRLGVRHALVGGLAVGAHGYPRATKGVDFLVGDEAFEHHAGGDRHDEAGHPDPNRRRPGRPARGAAR